METAPYLLTFLLLDLGHHALEGLYVFAQLLQLVEVGLLLGVGLRRLGARGRAR